MAEKVEKERLDVLLVQQGLANSRELAKAYIMAGNVYVDGQKEDKAGTKVAVTAKLEVKGNQMKYVSRGGYKLEKAMDVFGIRLDGKICLDIGASTGGFTDCMLQNGASKVYAIDVGYGQFAWKLRNDERVVCLEKTNVRYVTHEQVPDEATMLPWAAHDEVKLGKAQFYTVLEGEQIEAFDIEITALHPNTQDDMKGIEFRVTDSRLLKESGGIIQGMSGSPIVQDGKIVGAVTHVVTSSPDQGYGVFVEWMLQHTRSS